MEFKLEKIIQLPDPNVVAAAYAVKIALVAITTKGKNEEEAAKDACKASKINASFWFPLALLLKSNKKELMDWSNTITTKHKELFRKGFKTT